MMRAAFILAFIAAVSCQPLPQKEATQDVGACGLDSVNCGGGYCCPSWAECGFAGGERVCTPRWDRWP